MSALSKKDMQMSYDNHAGERENAGAWPGWKDAERNRVLAALRKEEARSLLEIGAGTGRDCLFFKENGLGVTAVDLSEEMVQLCRAKGLAAAQMDFFSLDFTDGRFDAVYAMNCLLHVPKAEIRDVLEEIRRVLAPGGLFYYGVYGGRDSEGVWDGDAYEPKRFFSFFTDDGLLEMALESFEVYDFRRIALEEGGLHFQGLLLRKTNDSEEKS